MIVPIALSLVREGLVGEGNCREDGLDLRCIVSNLAAEEAIGVQVPGEVVVSLANLRGVSLFSDAKQGVVRALLERAVHLIDQRTLFAREINFWGRCFGHGSSWQPILAWIFLRAITRALGAVGFV